MRYYCAPGRARVRPLATVARALPLGSHLPGVVVVHNCTTTGYRIQFLHHDAAADLEHALFIVAKGSYCGMGEIIYAVMLHMSQHTRNIYLLFMDAVRASVYDRVGKEAHWIPKNMENSCKVRVRLTFTRLHHFTLEAGIQEHRYLEWSASALSHDSTSSSRLLECTRRGFR